VVCVVDWHVGRVCRHGLLRLECRPTGTINLEGNGSSKLKQRRWQFSGCARWWFPFGSWVRTSSTSKGTSHFARVRRQRVILRLACNPYLLDSHTRPIRADCDCQCCHAYSVVACVRFLVSVVVEWIRRSRAGLAMSPHQANMNLTSETEYAR
jgi:hypothetical protein